MKPEEPVKEYHADDFAVIEEAREWARDPQVPDDLRCTLRHHLDNMDGAIDMIRRSLGLED